ncbi:hypothetical protein PPYR_14330 [Photinus pyralis]|uniref:Adenosine deaminase n=2 Tax=Photinus pyralis TaxID=7054 RepID=A0A5N4A500_PHOPY|nr:hypothetical protein PPYR_14330 [Photinus pyralis]
MLLVKCLYFATLVCLSLADYWLERKTLIEDESSQMLGSDVVLNAREQVVNNYLMGIKLAEYDAGISEPAKFLPSRLFFDVRASVEKSKVFEFIRAIPKGGLLHGHETAMLSFERLYNMTYEKGLYACIVDGRLKLTFSHSQTRNQSCDWKLLEDLRNSNDTYDQLLRSQLTLHLADGGYNDINAVWSAFQNIFGTITPMIMYRPFLVKYVYEALKELYEDKVNYVEIRGVLSTVYEINGKEYSEIETAGIYRFAVEEFKRDHPDFIGAKFIYAPMRMATTEEVKKYVNTVNELKRTYPDFIVGFDLVGQEDLGQPLSNFVNELGNVSSGIDLVFHAGETNWYGASSDLNLFDAVLLGTKRIGHGFGAIKHPLVTKLIKDRNIAVEICPISNQVLMLVADMRNHPAGSLMARGVPVVVGNDDPTFWGTKGLSYDFYMMFMGIASRNADLRLLKKLAENSLTYSLLPEEEKAIALEKWNAAWNQFIDSTYANVVRNVMYF